MPITSAMYALGKIIGPLVCELQAGLVGIGLIFYTLLVIAAVLMLAVILLNKHLRNVDHSKAGTAPAKEDPAPVSAKDSEVAPLLPPPSPK